MDKKDDAPKKAADKRPAPAKKAASWPTPSPNAGGKRMGATFDRKSIGRGAARGR